MSGFEAQCDCELDSPGVMSEHPVEFRLERWKEWALYLKKRIETHYRPAIAELKAELQLFHDFLGTPITGHFDEKSISGRFKEMVALEVECYSIAYDANKRQIAELLARIEEYRSLRVYKNFEAKLAKADETIAELQATVDGFPVKLVFQPVQIDESVDELIYTKEKLEQAEQRVRELEEFVTFVRRTAGDQWTDNVLAITAARLTAENEELRRERDKLLFIAD